MHDVERRLAEPSDTSSLGLVFSQCVELSSRSASFGIREPFRALAQRTIDARGSFPLTRGVPGAARDLVALAILAGNHDVDAAKTLAQWGEDVAFPSLPGFARAEWALKDRTEIVLPDPVVEDRLRNLDDELVHATPPETPPCCASDIRSGCLFFCDNRVPPLCALLGERAALTPAIESDRFFERLLSFDTGPYSCALQAALGMNGVAVERRARAAFEAIGEPGTKPTSSFAALAAGLSIAEHPNWVDAIEPLRAWLARQALTEGQGTAWSGEDPFPAWGEHVWLAWRPVLNRLVFVDSASPARERQQRARSIVAHWIELLRHGPGAAPSVGLETSLLLSVVALAPRVGLQVEASTLIAQAYARPDVAGWLFDTG
jgi:hypothetical protein